MRLKLWGTDPGQLYSLGLQLLGLTVSRASIAYLDEAVVKEVPIEQQHLQGAREKAEKGIESIRGKLYKPKKGYCKHCDQKAICKWGK